MKLSSKSTFTILDCLLFSIVGALLYSLYLSILSFSFLLIHSAFQSQLLIESSYEQTKLWLPYFSISCFAVSLLINFKIRKSSPESSPAVLIDEIEFPTFDESRIQFLCNQIPQFFPAKTILKSVDCIQVEFEQNADWGKGRGQVYQIRFQMITPNYLKLETLRLPKSKIFLWDGGVNLLLHRFSLQQLSVSQSV